MANLWHPIGESGVGGNALGSCQRQWQVSSKSFLGSFLDYDVKMAFMGGKRFMRIKYEKISLFCFIYGKLGHGESFCPLRVKVELFEVMFGWDLSLRVAMKRGRRWLATS
ncbi:hypothetical protein CXB51_025711 [Gossypium anomalum]|uniref:Zinc knuckle CX2CX4HX4C domain-containing protein n=1 Tax=Gossypium anomalum TaxID=47600 RepID=A0A8J5YK65_9ROSI|nr:hypothetical protein CXB51_025711 [Gossypium anomalum]